MIFLLSFLSGFAALVTPCVFPMVPMTVTFFTKRSKTRAAGIRNAIIFGVSIIVIYVLLGTVVTGVFGSSALNELATNVWFNLVFFLLLIVFAIAFLGGFEIRLPSSWLNKTDQAADKGGYVGIFFMALGLALVSFSCTGPIVGSLLVQSATIGGLAPFIGMFGFSLALALPFMLFAMFPGWLNTLPKSGGWLNTVKVVLGFLELALALKFLSNADLVVQAHYLERELFIAIWVGIFTVLALYLFGFIKLPHDDESTKKIGVGRALLATLILSFVFYILPGTWGAPVKLISGFPPPMTYSESGQSNQSGGTGHSSLEGTHPGPQNIPVFHDLEKAQAYAKSVNKPLFVDFTGYACQNCRKMEENVWGEPGIIDILRDQVVIVSLYVDDKTTLPAAEQGVFEYAPGKTMEVMEIGHKWSLLQAKRYQTNTQPYYRMLGPNGEDLSNGSADYEHHKDPNNFKSWLDSGLSLYKAAK
jgi:thiol:disulfide interchange protein DsbD